MLTHFSIHSCFFIQLDRNYERMLKIKLDDYNENKTTANLNAVKYLALVRIIFGEKVLQGTTSLIWNRIIWRVRLGLGKIYLTIYNNVNEAKKHAEEIYDLLVKDPSEVQYFVKFTGIKFVKSMPKIRFVAALIKLFKI